MTFPTDTSVHAAMVEFAAKRIAAGHLPFTSWFPNLALGSPQFLHYQSLASVAMGLVFHATSVTTSESAVAWSTYLLLALWPLCIYMSGRLLTLSPWTAAGASLASPFLWSFFSSGFEQRAYIFLGYGLWTQLFAMWTLPIAWGLTWRAVDQRKLVLPATIAVGLTICLHIEMGYLALLALVVWPWISRGKSGQPKRAGTALVVGIGALAMSCWVWVPLIAERNWSAINSVLAGTGYQKGYGAKTMLGWLFEGKLFDYQRTLPILTLVGAVGLVVSLAQWRRRRSARATVMIAVCSFVLECGITTFGSLADIIPGHQDLYFRRFAAGVQLAWLFLCGIGLVALCKGCQSLVRTHTGLGVTPRVLRWLLALAVTVVALIGLGTDISHMNTDDSMNANAIASQARSDSTQGLSIQKLINKMNATGPGRVYAGTINNFGSYFAVANVPVYKYLETEGVDVMVYSATTTSLMVDPEYYFDSLDPGDYSLLGIRYMILPAGMTPPIAATHLETASRFSLWEIGGSGYIRIVDTVGSLDENRSDIGPASAPYMHSQLPEFGEYLTVGYGGSTAPKPTVPSPHGSNPSEIEPTPSGLTAGSVLSESDNLDSGEFESLVSLSRKAVVAFSETYDPGWTATVDGKKVPIQMLAPAIMGVELGPGVHTVKWEYTGYGDYDGLFGISLIVLIGGCIWVILARRRRGAGIT